MFLGAVAQAQTLAPGQIKAAKVENMVTKVAANGTSTPLKDGDSLTETDTVQTANNSSVVLVFMNGSSVHVGPDSELKIEEFQMDPLAVGTQVNMANLQEEPSTSKTVLNLTHGELVGSVKKLHTDRGSSYNVKTPVGAAGIRGTVFRIVFRPDGTGKAFFTVTTAEGRVVMTGVTTTEIPIPAGKEVVVQADVTTTPAPSTGPGTPPGATTTVVSNVEVVGSGTHDTPPATTAAITSASNTILQSNAVTTFVQTPPPTGGTGGTGSTGGDQKKDDSSSSGNTGGNNSNSGNSNTGGVTPSGSTTGTPRLTAGDGT
jgi:hypothetical protein